MQNDAQNDMLVDITFTGGQASGRPFRSVPLSYALCALKAGIELLGKGESVSITLAADPAAPFPFRD